MEYTEHREIQGGRSSSFTIKEIMLVLVPVIPILIGCLTAYYNVKSEMTMLTYRLESFMINSEREYLNINTSATLNKDSVVARIKANELSLLQLYSKNQELNYKIEKDIIYIRQEIANLDKERRSKQ